MAETNPTPPNDSQLADLQKRLETAGLLNTGKQAEASKAVAGAGLSTDAVHIYRGKHYIFIVDK